VARTWFVNSAHGINTVLLRACMRVCVHLCVCVCVCVTMCVTVCDLVCGTSTRTYRGMCARMFVTGWLTVFVAWFVRTGWM